MGAEAALDGLLEAFSRCLNPEAARQVVQLQIDASLQAQIDQLAEQANEGTLSEADRREYEALINAADIISILKLKARHQLQAKTA